MFGEDIESIEPEEEYEESIAERAKTRRQNKQRTFAPPSPPKEDYFEETHRYLKHMKEKEKDRKKFSDEYDSSVPHRFKYNLIDKLDLKNLNKSMALANLSIYYT